jgi:hypothetical protein
MRLAAGMLQELPVYFAATSDGSLSLQEYKRGEFVNRVTDAGRLLEVSPDKRGYRTSGVLVRHLSGNPTYRELAICFRANRVREYIRVTNRTSRIVGSWAE